MADNMTPAQRSTLMSKIRGKDTRPEMLVRRYLHGAGLRFRLHGRRLPGRPDLVLRCHMVVVFVHGCFWHRHAPCVHARVPASNVDYWLRKFEANVARDARAQEALQRGGWTPIVIWECETKAQENLDGLFWKIIATSAGNNNQK